MHKKKKILEKLFEEKTKEKIVNITPLPPSGSSREYYRLKGQNFVLLSAYNPDVKENNAFFHFSSVFKSKGLPVPEVYSINEDKTIYLLEDLGENTLFDYISAKSTDENTENIINLYKQVIDYLPLFQITGAKHINFEYCYPRKAFDKQSMLWDLSYFKYYFLKLANIPFDEQLLEDDFHVLTNFLLKTDCNYFLYRDFQSRNIIITDGKPYFIDYQGGRKGALQYDLASLLYDAKANLSNDLREHLLNYYLQVLNTHISLDTEEFKKYYYGYVLIRIMQAMGAYGFRGFYEKKTHFLQSIPFAIKNLRYLLDNITFSFRIPTLLNILDKLTNSERLKKLGTNNNTSSKLTVYIHSFSYKNGISFKDNPHGGGFVFDCRPLPNPGREEKYKYLSGLDKDVIKYLDDDPRVSDFLFSIFQIIDLSVENYISRDFEFLSVAFGCTGGQHRSVYCAERLKKHLISKYNINVTLQHKEKTNWLRKE